MADSTLLQNCSIAIGGLLTTAATVKIQIKDLERRVDAVEKCNDELPEKYVPRRELDQKLQSVVDAMTLTRRYVAKLYRLSKKEKQNGN